MSIELQNIDCNCNDCKFMQRDFEKYKSFDKLYTNEKGIVTRPSYRINYGNCTKFNKPVSFIPNHCQLETQNCFIHRKS
jgi:hypothetical protein